METSRKQTRIPRGIAAVASILLASFVLVAPGAFAVGGGTPTIGETYGGRAFGVWVEVPLFGGTGYGDTGSLPSSGGVLVADFTPVDTGVADATVFLSYARGFDSKGLSEVATAEIVLLEGTAFEVAASFLYTRSEAVCDGASGTSEIFGLTVGGVAFPVSGAPNQVYSVPGVFTMIVNEQVDSSSGATKAITVNALHVWSTGVEVIVASAYSAITCTGFGFGLTSSGGTRSLSGGGGVRTFGGGVTPLHPGEEPQIPADFMTGGGFFEPPNSNRPGRVNFGFNAGPRPGQPTEVKGHLNLIDHHSGDHLSGVNVDFYARFFANDPQDVCRWFGGDAKWNGVPGYRYATVVCDYGEPGRFDRFATQVHFGLNGEVVYYADNARSSCPPDKLHCGELDGGNIQLHRHRNA